MTPLEKALVIGFVLALTAGVCALIILLERVLAIGACVVLCAFAVRVLLESTS